MSLCIAVVANKKYERYIPYFCFFVKKSYPKCNVKIFALDGLSDKVKNFVHNGYRQSEVKIIERLFDGFPQSNQELKSLRWLIPKEHFSDYEYVYIGDIDMLICKEPFGLLEQHKKHCFDNQLPYSNCVRPNTKRLTGLHFFETKAYYEKMSKVIEKYTKALRGNRLGLRSGTRNEEVLYSMIVEAGFSLPADEFRIDIDGSGPHHGLHLGIWRSGGNIKPAVIDQIMKDSYLEHFEYFEKASKERTFSRLEKEIPLKELARMRVFFEAYRESV
jgi:hypothetical protein